MKSISLVGGSMTTLIRQYKCDICNAIYDSMDRAQNCENQGIPECSIDVGDIVIPKGKSHGWFDGKSEWQIELKIKMIQTTTPNPT